MHKQQQQQQKVTQLCECTCVCLFYKIPVLFALYCVVAASAAVAFATTIISPRFHCHCCWRHRPIHTTVRQNIWHHKHFISSTKISPTNTHAHSHLHKQTHPFNQPPTHPSIYQNKTQIKVLMS